MKHLIKFLKGKSIVVTLNKLLKLVLRNNDYEYELVRSSSKAQMNYLFQLMEPVECGHELIRIGADNDGGYLIPDDLTGVKYCFSPGVGASTEFEENLVNYEIKSFLADPTVSIPSAISDMIEFDKIPITPSTGDLIRLKMFDDLDTSEKLFEGVSLTDWINSKIPINENDSILQLDIEGGEYQVLLSTPLTTLDKFRIICVEFHSFPNIRNSYFLSNIAIPLIEKLKMNFDVAHIHPNNIAESIKFLNYSIPHALEITFHRKDRRKYAPNAVKNLDHPLDKDTLPNKPSVKFKLN